MGQAIMASTAVSPQAQVCKQVESVVNQLAVFEDDAKESGAEDLAKQLNDIQDQGLFLISLTQDEFLTEQDRDDMMRVAQEWSSVMNRYIQQGAQVA